MNGKPVVASITPQTPLIDKSTGQMSFIWIKWFQGVQQAINAAFDQQGNFDGNLGPDATISGRNVPILVILHNIDDTGVMTGPGIDFTRPYLNKNTDNIGDGTGSPLAGGKTAYAAMVASSPTAGELLGYDGTKWTPQQKAHSLNKVIHQWLDSYNELTGQFTQSQPSFSDISGTAQPSQGGTGASEASANRIFAGPPSGSPTAPSFRALVPSDIPASPASFQAARSSIVTNVTGDGSDYTVVFDTSLYNVGSAYNTSTGVFTAPVTGKYLFSAAVLVTNLSSGHTIGWIALSQSNASFPTAFSSGMNPFAVQRSDGFCGMNLVSTILNLNAGDAVSLKVHIAGSTKTVSVYGSTPSSSGLNTFFNGIYLSS